MVAQDDKDAGWQAGRLMYSALSGDLCIVAHLAISQAYLGTHMI